MLLIERNDLSMDPIEAKIWKFFQFFANFFSIAAFLSSSVDPPSQESTDGGLTAIDIYLYCNLSSSHLIWNMLNGGKPVL